METMSVQLSFKNVTPTDFSLISDYGQLGTIQGKFIFLS